MTGPVPARYEGLKREYPVLPGILFSVWDSFTQSWCEDESHTSASAAIDAAGRLNREYEGEAEP